MAESLLNRRAMRVAAAQNLSVPYQAKKAICGLRYWGGGLAHSEDSGKSFRNLSNEVYCGAVGIGKAQTPGGYETIFIYGTVRGVLGVHRSTDKGATWLRINNDKHQYGGPGNGQFIQGDMNVFGRVYMSTAGRGIAYGSITTS